jgi:hypothetical protein
VKRACLIAAATFSMGGNCGGGGGCPAPVLPQPMTEIRAHAIDPSVTTGVAFSTTHIFGDCRSDQPKPKSTCGTEANPACAMDRAPLRVLVVPVNMSVPLSSDCPGAYRVRDLENVAVVNALASDAGELVKSVDPGRYQVAVSADDRCAACGLAEQGMGCFLDVVPSRLTVRDLVLDESAH